MSTSDSPIPIFLGLPLELRRQIYAYVLPNNGIESSRNDSEWHSGSVSLFRVNRRIHAEAIAVLFENITFHIRVECDRLHFVKTYFLPKARIPLKVALPFPGALGRNLWRIQNVAVQLYSPMNVEDGTDSRSLALVARAQKGPLRTGIGVLALELEKIECLRQLHISICTGVPNFVPEGYKEMLQQLELLENVQTVVWG